MPAAGPTTVAAVVDELVSALPGVFPRPRAVAGRDMTVGDVGRQRADRGEVDVGGVLDQRDFLQRGPFEVPGADAASASVLVHRTHESRSGRRPPAAFSG